MTQSFLELCHFYNIIILCKVVNTLYISYKHTSSPIYLCASPKENVSYVLFFSLGVRRW